MNWKPLSTPYPYSFRKSTLYTIRDVGYGILLLTLGVWLFSKALRAEGKEFDMFRTLQTMRADYPTPLGKINAAALLSRAACQNGWALLRVDDGGCPLPDGRRVSCEYVVHIEDRRAFAMLHDVDVQGYVLITGDANLSDTARLLWACF